MERALDTTRDLLSYWQLQERPFEATWDTRFYYPTADHDEALDRLSFLVTEQSMNMGLLTGDIGCGKTLLRAVFAEQLEADEHFEIVVQENSGFGFRDLLGSILAELGDEQGGRRSSRYSRYQRFQRLTEELHQEGLHLVLIFDEAQEMAPATLNELKLLTNFNGRGENYLTVILLGQPELRQRVAQLPAIDQRISLRFHLSPLTQEDTGLYLRHRLLVAGHADGDLFTEEAIERAYRATCGIPREVNRLAKLSLELAWLKELPQITAATVEAVIRDLQRHQSLRAA